MAITLQQETSIMKMASALFNKAFNPEMVTGFVSFYESNNNDLSKLADALIGSSVYTAQYNGAATVAEYSTILMAHYGLSYTGTTAADTNMKDFIAYSFTNKASWATSLQTIQAVDKYLTATFVPSITSADPIWGTMAKANVNKAEVAIAFKNNPSNAGKELSLASVTDDRATVDAATDSATAGSTFVLTEGVDSIVGGAGNDTINALHKTGAPVVGGLDTIDGGAGIDTFNIVDTLTGAAAQYTQAATITNVEKINITTNGGILENFSANTALTAITTVAAGSANTSVTASGTATVTTTVAGTATTTISGGTVVKATGGTGITGVTGNALTDVTVTKGGAVTIDNLENSVAATTAKGTTLKSVTLTNVDANSAIKGAAIAELTLNGTTAAARTITITNATVAHDLKINANGTGYTAAAVAAQTVVTDTVATTATINTTVKSSLDLSNSTAVKTLTLTGAGELTLAANGANVTAIAGSAATGALLLGTLNAAAVTVSTGAGADVFTTSATAKTTIDTGAGNDILTLGAALAAGSTVNLGTGNDTLLGATVIAASTVSAVTVVDGGDGVDTLASTLINAGNAAQFKNFEKISVGNATVDAALLTNSTIVGLSIDGNTGTGVLQNVTAAQSLTVNANNGGTSSTLTFTGVTAKTDAYDITFNANTTGTTASPTTIDAKIVSIEGIENVTIHSGAAAGVTTNAIALKAVTGQSVTIDGAQALNLTFNTAFGNTTTPNTGVTSIDGSAATGKLGINLTNVVAATAGIEVKGGSAVDTITTIVSQSTTLTGNGGNDNFVTDATIAGTTDAATAYITTIKDFTKGDVLSLNNANAGTAAFTATKVDVSSAISLDAAVDLAMTGDGSTNAIVKWFNYGADTYVTVDGSASATLAATLDQIVKLTGTLDLSTSSMNAAADLTFA